MVSAIVLAAGNGTRIKSKIAKQYIILEGKPILYYSLKAFQDSVVDEIVLVTRPQDIDMCENLLIEETSLTKVKKIVAGGKERYDSVQRGLDALSPESQYVLIHDGARPFVDQVMIQDSIDNVIKFHACTVGMPVKDTIKIIDNECMGVATPDRSYVYQIQTPQTFNVQLLKDAYRKLNRTKTCSDSGSDEFVNIKKIGISDELVNYEKANNNFNITDDTMIVERFMGVKVKVIEGSYTNIKITTQEDLQVAKVFLKNLKKLVDKY